MESRKQAILAALDAFVRQRAGLEFGNYGDVRSYRAEARSITRDLHRYRAIRAEVAQHESLTADMLLEASRSAFSGRLELVAPHSDGKYDGYNLSDSWYVAYCTGQYFPIEYRKAACAVLASALWAWTREHAMPAPTSWRVESWSRLGADRERSKPLQIHEACALLEQKGGQSYGYVQEYIAGKTPGDWLRAHFRKLFGRGIADGYFN